MTDLDERLQSYFEEIARRTPVHTPHRFDLRRPTGLDASEAPLRFRRAALVAAAVAIVVAAIGVTALVVRSGGREQSPADPAATLTIPATDPVLWVPDATARGTSITQYMEAAVAPLATGAAIAPDGTVFGITVSAIPGTPLGGGEARMIDGHRVIAQEEPTVPGYVARSLRHGCLTIAVSSNGADMWSADAEALIRALRVEGSAVNVVLPPGWQSLGAGEAGRQFGVAFQTAVSGATGSFTLWQLPNVPVGSYLGSVSGRPSPLASGAWLIPPGPGEEKANTVIAERDGTTFVLSGAASGAELEDIARSMVRAPLSSWASNRDPEVSDVTTASAAPGCASPSLSIG